MSPSKLGFYHLPGGLTLLAQAMFSTDLMESRQERVAINGVEPQMIGMLVSYAYTAEVVISKANVQALLAAANLLDVMAVREACCRFMERQMDEMNCVGIHCFAEAHSCRELERCSMEYIQQHFSTVCKQVKSTTGDHCDGKSEQNLICIIVYSYV